VSAADARDLDFMGAALSLARRGLGQTSPNPAVACLLVKNGQLVGRGWTQPGGRPHAETMALAQAGAVAQGATAYVTLEPCAHTGLTPPCAEALVKARIARAVIAITDPDPRVSGQGVEILKKAGIEVCEGIGLDDAWRANQGFFLTRTENRPLFTLKLATDVDGRIPGPKAQGEDKWVTSPEARKRGHLLRADHDAVLFGIGTVLADDPAYTCRLAGLQSVSPVRVLLDHQLRLPPHANLLKTLDISPLWVVCGRDAERAESLKSKGVTLIRAPTRRPAPEWLAGELVSRGLTRVLIESGPTLVNAFLEAGLVDEMAWFRSARPLAVDSVAAFQEDLLEKLAFKRQAVLRAGPDQLELYDRRT